MWTKIDAQSDASMDRPNINALIRYVQNLRTGGYSNWRFPTMEELRSLYETHKNNRTAGGITIHVDPIFQQANADLLSSEPGGFLKGDWRKAFSFIEGRIYEAWPGYQNGHSVRAVRNP